MKILNKLLGGDLRSIGNADEIISEILNNPTIATRLYNF